MKKGFTLVEFTIVMAILAILIAVAIPMIQEYRFKNKLITSVKVIDKNKLRHSNGTFVYNITVEYIYKDGSKLVTWEPVDGFEYHDIEIGQDWIN